MTDEELHALVRKASAAYERMTPQEREVMRLRQITGIAKAEASWPPAKFKWINGVKVYDSYEDYCR